MDCTEEDYTLNDVSQHLLYLVDEHSSHKTRKVCGNLLDLLEDETFGVEATNRVKSACRAIALEKRTNEWERLFKSLADFTFMHNARPKNRYGQCGYRSRKYGNYVEVHPVLLKRDGAEEYNNTLLHEIAHALAYLHYGRVSHGHGRVWQNIMRWLGLEPERCKSGAFLDEEEETSKWTYTCKSCGYQWNYHRRMKRYQNRYHSKCRKNGLGGELAERHNH
jgi:predicted SprT family Zn-dependent metalloprotease